MLWEGENKIFWEKFFYRVSETKSWQKISNFRYGLPADFLRKVQKPVGRMGGGVVSTPVLIEFTELNGNRSNSLKIFTTLISWISVLYFKRKGRKPANFYLYFLKYSLLLDYHFADFFLKKVHTIDKFSLKLVAMTFATKKFP